MAQPQPRIPKGRLNVHEDVVMAAADSEKLQTLAQKLASKHYSTYSLPDIDVDEPVGEEEQLKLRPVNLTDLLRLCSQARFETFESFLGAPALDKIEKIGEATFSQVFQIPLVNATVLSNIKSFSSRAIPPTAAVKIVPFGGESQQTLSEMYQELRITGEMSDIASEYGAGFVRVLKMGVVRGAYPPQLIEAVEKYSRRRGKKAQSAAAQVKTQKYAVLVLEHAGLNLAEGPQLTWTQTCGVIGQIVLSLAIAEQSCKFEHRDLHWGNMMAKIDKNEKTRRLVTSDCNTVYDVKTGGMHTTIIDYTLSRLEINGDFSQLCAVPLTDEVFFTGYGDFQFEIYRLMRSENGGDWLKFTPKTNIFWIWYLVDKLLVWKYKPFAKQRGVPLSVGRNRRTLELFINRIPNYGSAQELLEDPFFKRVITRTDISQFATTSKDEPMSITASTKAVMTALATRMSRFMHLD
ncbi:hypothetical protein SmJEL517_g04060 [Synchytrium microbalum]|uniref:non-specific serine/threonine protein kinase n=1 Tax=Synchytrium microbalum TaxID=1806994 RepID=A0A507C465_9FUNG|nr:uncharacterized protein SmJEL517_g04060 [Synchytrium microbalum]TPX32904.1 hypothetical protein SmJEL517_g04060 [Synchytrium microbalum]